MVSLNQISDLSKLADTMGATETNSDKQKLLETLSVKERLTKIIDFMDDEIGVLQVEKRLSRVKRQMDKHTKNII